MKNENLIKLIQAECDDFANKVMEIYNSKNIMIQFNVFDPEEMRKDAMKDEQTSEANPKHLFDEDVFGVNEFFDYVDSVFKKGRKINE